MTPPADPDDLAAPDVPDEPVDPDAKPVPENDRSTPEDYHVPDRDPEVPLEAEVAPDAALDPEEAYPHVEDEEEERA